MIKLCFKYDYMYVYIDAIISCLLFFCQFAFTTQMPNTHGKDACINMVKVNYSQYKAITRNYRARQQEVPPTFEKSLKIIQTHQS